MEFLSREGRFWLPRQTDRTVHGLVTFQEDRVTLNLEGALHAPDPGGSGGGPVVASEPVIHGSLRDGRQVTLFQASGLNWPIEGVQETWQAEFLLVGGAQPIRASLRPGSAFCAAVGCLSPAWDTPRGDTRTPAKPKQHTLPA
jgi:hypothetical protein